MPEDTQDPENSLLQREFAEAATEAEAIAGEAFTFRGGRYRGTFNQQPVLMALTVPGMEESAEGMLQATVVQFGESAPDEQCAQKREIIRLRRRDWKIVSFESDSLHVRFGLTLTT